MCKRTFRLVVSAPQAWVPITARGLYHDEPFPRRLQPDNDRRAANHWSKAALWREISQADQQDSRPNLVLLIYNCWTGDGSWREVTLAVAVTAAISVLAQANRHSQSQPLKHRAFPFGERTVKAAHHVMNLVARNR